VTYRILGLLCASLLAGSTSAQGLRWSTTMAGEQIGTQEVTTAYMPGMLLLNGMNSGGDAMIFRFDRQMIHFLKRQGKKVTSVSFSEFEAGMKKMETTVDAQMAEALKQLEALPPEERARVEQQLGTFLPKKEEGEILVTKGGETKSIAGYRAVRYTASRNGQEFLSAWTSSAIPGWKRMKTEFATYMAQMSGVNQFGKGFREAFGRIEGFPLAISMAGFTSTVTKIEVQNTPAAEFEVPPDYTEDPNDLFGGSGKQEHEE
jgi:hypothetical protein